MKYLYLFAFISFLSINSSSAQSTHEINKLDKETELLLDSAAKHMTLFILTQNAAEYDLAIEKVNRAEEDNKTLVTKSANEKGVAGKIEKELISEREEEIASYRQVSLKEDILKEKASDRKVKVKFKGKPYSLSAKSKKHFDLFSSYLPKN
jgi:hypothetical protein